MKIRFDLQNRRHRGFLMVWVAHVMFAIQIVELEAERRALGFIALGLVIISIIFLQFSTADRVKVIALCVGVAGLAFLSGYMITIAILK